jgi:hypothetical protein
MSLQRGMNFFEPPGISIVLMSRRRNAPYEDELSADGTELVYEGASITPENVRILCARHNLSKGARIE